MVRFKEQEMVVLADQLKFKGELYYDLEKMFYLLMGIKY